MQDRIDWEDLRLLRAIGESGSLSGAAKRLGIDHSTAFRRLGGLEERLGVRLFDRARDGYAPTPAGEAALAGAGTLLEGLDELRRKLAGQDLRPSGMVRVTTTDTLLGLLAPMLAEFRDLHPDIVLEVAAANAFFSLARRDADVAIRPAAEAPEDLAGRRVAEIATAAYAAPAYLAGMPAQTPLAEHRWLGPDDSLAHLASARWLRGAVAAERVVLRGNSLMVLHAAARAGLGVAPLPCGLADPDPALVRVAGPFPAMAAGLWLLTHPDLRRVARIRVFLDFMAERLNAARPLLEGRGQHLTHTDP